MKQLKFISGMLMLLVLSSCGRSGQSNQETTIQEYPVVAITKQNASLESVYPATIKGTEDVEIRPRVEGFIENIFVDEGSVVKAGQALFKVNSPSSEQAFTTAQAAVNSAQAQVNTAQVNVERYRPLAEKGIVSEVQLKIYQNAYESAQASLEQAKATLKNAQATIGWTTVKSPVNGIVGQIAYRKGSLVNSSNTLTTVANTDNVFAYFSLNEKKLMDLLANVEGNTQSEKIKNLSSVSLILADGANYEEPGRIETISGIVNTTTGSANFRAEFPNKLGKIKSGTSAKVVMPKILSDVFVIPQKSTFKQQDKVLVYKFEGDSVRQQIITVLPMPDGQSYAVTEGLSDGEKIVFDGIATLRNGMKIKAGSATSEEAK